MYSDPEVILGEMEVFTSQNEDNSDLMKDVSEDVSLDPLVLISNLNKRFKREEITWKYNNRSQHASIKTGNTAMFYKFHFHWASYLVLKNRM